MTAKRKKTTKKGAFLAAYAKVGNVTRAAKLAKCERTRVYAWIKDDPEFAVALNEAGEEATELMEEEARRRAVEGTLKPVFHQGEQCGVIREYSDTLLIFLLKGRKPGMYRERIDHSGKMQMEHTVRVVQRDDFYGNEAHLPDDSRAASLTSPDPSPGLPCAVQAGGVRPAVGQNGHGTNGRGHGPRSDSG